MGQKVNPVGFRTGIMIGWKSRWYASKQEFADLLIEDQKIRDFVKNRKDKFGKPLYPAIAKIEIERTRDEVKVILFSARPGSGPALCGRLRGRGPSRRLRPLAGGARVGGRRAPGPEFPDGQGQHRQDYDEQDRACLILHR